MDTALVPQRSTSIRLFRRLRPALVGTVLLAALATAAPARADEATAESLFKSGTALAQSGKYADACPKFLESQKQSPALGTLVALGDCYYKLGKNASAWATYKDLAFAAKKAGDTARADAAAKRAAELEAGLSMLQINAADATTPQLVIRRDGEEQGRGALGTPIAVDPGSHIIEATAPGYEVWQTTVTIGANKDTKTVLIPALQKKEIPDGGPQGEAPNKTKRLVGIIVGGVGVASLGLGAVTGALAMSDASSAQGDDKLCGADKKCTTKGRSTLDSANTQATISTIGFGVGIAAVGVGAYLILTSRGKQPASDAAPPRAASFVPQIGPQGGGFSYAGSF